MYFLPAKQTPIDQNDDTEEDGAELVFVDFASSRKGIPCLLTREAWELEEAARTPAPRPRRPPTTEINPAVRRHFDAAWDNLRMMIAWYLHSLPPNSRFQAETLDQVLGYLLRLVKEVYCFEDAPKEAKIKFSDDVRQPGWADKYMSSMNQTLQIVVLGHRQMVVDEVKAGQWPADLDMDGPQLEVLMNLVLLVFSACVWQDWKVQSVYSVYSKRNQQKTVPQE